MDSRRGTRLLSIGEFAAATQLSPKALRLYDEQGILRPALVEATNGYRYYRDDQIALGRLIRTLRDMDLPLADVRELVAGDNTARAEAILRRHAEEGERHVARQRRAYQAALALLHPDAPADAPAVSERERPALTVALRPFLAERRFLIEQFRREMTAGYAELAAAGVAPAGAPFCLLIDPASDDEGRAEVAIPVAAPRAIPTDISLRQLPARRCAVLTWELREAEALDLAAATDSLFDWFDRHGYHAAESPSAVFASRERSVHVELAWAFEPVVVPIPVR